MYYHVFILHPSNDDENDDEKPLSSLITAMMSILVGFLEFGMCILSLFLLQILLILLLVIPGMFLLLLSDANEHNPQIKEE